ncbi:MAG: hypothetical protein DRN40_00415 [Thermoplasmata archaeon]|nr:MAG: hypothetical protein DRN40_00415 [Thermoplasmata archaeon]
MDPRLWSKDEERIFFKKTLEIATPEQLFYLTDNGRFLAYWPKKYKGKKTTLQSRNAFIGSYTEKWIKDLLTPLAREFEAYAIHNVVCDEIGLGERSPADVAIVKTPKREQKPEDILLLVEVKMSIVWNWEYHPESGDLDCIGDFTTHQGNPGLLRSDTMLKAIGKSINIRVSGYQSSKIPIIVIGNTPIMKTYYKKVDFLKKAGIIQGFYSVNPNPLDKPSKNNIKSTPEKGFLRVDKINELYNNLEHIIEEDKEFFSSMLPKKELGRIIEVANREPTYEKKAEKFLILLRGIKNE